MPITLGIVSLIRNFSEKNQPSTRGFELCPQQSRWHILVYGVGNTIEEANVDQNQNLEALLKRCREQNIALNRDKLKLECGKEVSFMGHILTGNGVKMDPDKAKAVQEIPRPEDIEGIQRLNGFVNYLTKFLPGLADVIEPLHRLTWKDAEWKWSGNGFN